MVQNVKKCVWRRKKITFILALTHLYSHIFYEKKATVTTDASEKTISGVFLQEGNPVIYVSRKLTPAQQKYPNIER